MAHQAYERLQKEMKKHPKRISKKVHMDKWRKYWREAGPVRFAEEYLFCPINVPPYPNWKELQEESYCKGCKKMHKKFRNNGVPYHIILSEQQKELLLDLWERGQRLIIVSAGRGCGKTFIVAVWDCWRMACFDHYQITVMGGSQEQSEICQEYIDYWRGVHPEVEYIVNKSTKGIHPKATSRYGAKLKFSPCSPTAARGPHVNEVQADEACTAEAKGKDGIAAIKALDWQITGRPDTYIMILSTSHYLFGRFYEILSDPKKFGDFKVYFWTIADHVSGKPVEQMYKDKNPKNWKPAVWWMSQKNIRKLRRKTSDEEWLCEALGRPSMASGAVFKREDLDIIICGVEINKQCENCIPYKWGYCKLIEQFQLGHQADPIAYIIERRAGYDYGDVAPNALTIGGRKTIGGKTYIFILFNDEIIGLRPEELIKWITNHLKIFRCFTIIPDPSAAGAIVSRRLDELGFATYIIGEAEKAQRVWIVKKIIERHAIIIPKAFWHLTDSLRKLAYDEKGKIRKINDHSFDSLQYLCVDWGDIVGEGGNIEDVFAVLLGKKTVEKIRKGEDVPTGIPDLFG